MVKKQKKAKKSLKNGSPVDNVDTSSMSLKQLQSFCERVYKEVVKVELESRSLELERTKLKTMVELSTHELIQVKRNRRDMEFNLEKIRETIEFDGMDLQKQLRNVRNEKNKEMLIFMSVANNNFKNGENDSNECKTNIEEDLKMLRSEIKRLEVHKNSQSLVLSQQLEKEKSYLLSTFENDSKLQTTEYDKQSLEISLKLKNKFNKIFEGFNVYKDRIISGYLDENDKLTISLQHYYERLLRHNTGVLNGMHEEYKRVKEDAKQVTNTLKNQKDVVDKCKDQLETNNEKIKELSGELAHVEQDKKVLKKTKGKLTSLKTSLKTKRMHHLFIEEAVEMMKEKKLKFIEEMEKKIFCLQKNVSREILRLECWEMKIRTNIKNMDDIIGTYEPNISQHLSMPQVRTIVFAQLEKEAKLEENPKIKIESDITTTLVTGKSVNTTPSILFSLRKLNFSGK